MNHDPWALLQLVSTLVHSMMHVDISTYKTPRGEPYGL
jgi:hypothetical protein